MGNLTGIISPPPLRDKIFNDKIHSLIMQLYLKNNPISINDGLFSEQMHRFLTGIYQRLNQRESYGFPSVVLNPDFNFSTGGVTPVTQGDAYGTPVVDMWDAEYAGTPTFTFTPTVYDPSNPNPTASKYYINMQPSDLGTFLRLAQTQGGTVQKYSNQPIYFSTAIFNNGTNSPKVRPSVIISLNGAGDTAEYFGGEFNLTPGTNKITTLITTPSIEDLTVTTANFVQFCFYITDIDGISADFDVQYLKYELASNATTLYVDHALEAARLAFY